MPSRSIAEHSLSHSGIPYLANPVAFHMLATRVASYFIAAVASAAAAATVVAAAAAAELCFNLTGREALPTFRLASELEMELKLPPLQLRLNSSNLTGASAG